MVEPRRARSSRSGGPEDGAGGSEPADERRPKGTAKDRALLLLGVRWRSREELRGRLARAGFEPQDIERALEDLERVGLIDDERFAREVVRDQTARRHASDRAIRSALYQKGVAGDQVERMLAGLADEESRANGLAEVQARKLAAVPVEAAQRRIMGLLLRRGYGHALAREASGRALATRMGEAEIGADDA